MKWKQLIKQLKYACELSSNLNMQQAKMILFMPGSYEREYEDAGVRIAERIIINRISEVSEMYRIKKVVCRYVTKEEKIIRESSADQWTAAYDLSKRQLFEITGQRSCAFIPEDSVLILNNVKYFKSPTKYIVF